MVQHQAQVVSARPRTEDVQVGEDVSFKSMLLPKPLLKGLKKARYFTPSPIQQKALPLVRCGLDLIVQAKAGTGKTCVFTVAALEMVRPELSHLQAIILAPTREVALQILDVVNALGREIAGLKSSCFIGGYPVKDDQKNAGCHIAVGTPGRMKQLVDNGVLNVKHVRLFVLDEADKLMEKVFILDINGIYERLPRSKQMLVCSATYTPELIQVLGNYMHRAQYITPHSTVNPTVLIGVRQLVSVLPLHVDKLATLKLKERRLIEILRFVPFNQCLVFSNIHSRAESVCNLLRKQGFGVDWIAGKQQQADRVIALAQLKEQKVRILVTTDLTARGIDVENVNLVVNLDIPFDHHTYLHRMGRAGRYGSHGMVITIVPAQDLGAFRKLLGKIGGTSQSVRCIPEDFKTIDLRTVPDENLKQLEDETIEACEESDSSTDSEEKLPKESSTSQKKIEVNGATNSVLKVNGNNHNAEDSSGSSTSTDEKLSQSSSGSGEDRRDNGTEAECSCGLYEVKQSDLELITQPSLFAASEMEEHWVEVLPVEISEKRMPLNIKVALVGSKFIRVRSLDRSKDESKTPNEDFQCDEFVDFGSPGPSGSLKGIPSFRELIAVIEKQPVENFDCENESLGEEKCSGQKDDVSDNNKESDVTLKLQTLKEQFEFYRNAQKNRENFFQKFDSFDVVGWVAVDVQNNILDSLNIDDSDIFQFNLKTCAAGKSHIEVQSVTNTEAVEDDVRPFDDHILTFNLNKLGLVLPTSLKDIADKLKALDNATKTKSEVPETAAKKDVLVIEPVRHSGKSTKSLKQHKKVTPSKFLSESKNPQQNGHCKTNGNIKSSLKKTSLEVKKSPDFERSNSKNKIEPKPLSHGARKKHSPSKSLARPSVSENLQIAFESISRIKASNANKVESKADISIDLRRSSAGTEDSGPYVDMSNNLMKWQELHDFIESDSETSSESDLLNPFLSQRVRETYSDSSDCSYKTSQAIKHREVLSRLSKKKNKKQGETTRKTPQLGTTESYDTGESENSHRHSFKTATSLNVSFENLTDPDPIQLSKQKLQSGGFSKFGPNDARENKISCKGKGICKKKQSRINDALKEFKEVQQQSTSKKNQSYQEENSHHYFQQNVPDQREVKQSKTGHKQQKQSLPELRHRRENLMDPTFFSQNYPYYRYFSENAQDLRNFSHSQDPRYLSQSASDPRYFSHNQRSFSQNVPDQTHFGQNLLDQRYFNQDFPDPSSDRKAKKQQQTDSHRRNRRDPRILTSNNLFADWCSTWYSEVRQRAQQLEFAEYINSMTSNL